MTDDLDVARTRLMDLLCNYGSFTNSSVTLVFDAYRVAGGMGSEFDYHNIKVIYTKEHETGDTCIDRLLPSFERDSIVRLVTSDWLVQVSALRAGVTRISAAEFEREVARVNGEIDSLLGRMNSSSLGTLGERLLAKAEMESLKSGRNKK